MKRLLPLIVISCVLSYRVSAQSTCTQTLRTARSTYDQGRLHELPSLLEGCIKNGFTQQEKVEAYKLLTLAYIYLEEPTKADEAMLNLLNTDHYFEINVATDPAEFIALYKTFRTKPIYRLGGKIGANATQPNVIETVKGNEGTSKYKYGIGVQVYVTAEIPISETLTLNTELGFQQRAFTYTNQVSFTDTTFTTTAKENQSWISLPVSIQYQFNTIKFKPYIALGVQGAYLLSDVISAQRSRKGSQAVDEKSFDLKPQREAFNIGAIASVGAHFRLGGGFVTTEIRFVYGINKINSAVTGFGVNEHLSFDYGYADNTFKLNSLSVTAGYVYNIFKPKKLRSRK